METQKPLAAVLAALILSTLASASSAALLSLDGPVSYSCNGGVGVLTAGSVSNVSAGGYSGTIKLELWALPSPFNGNFASGYKLAEHTLGQLVAGYQYSNIQSGAVLCLPPPNGVWRVAIIATEYVGVPYDYGYDAKDWINFDDPWIVGPVLPPPPEVAGVVEYYHAGFGHYFITSDSNEIAKLDAGVFVGWARTGYTFNVYQGAPAGSSPVCRFFSTAFAPKSSHFYTPNASECATVKRNPSWQFEAAVFNAPTPDAAGNCAFGSSPIYRLYNNGQGAAPNHRYTTSLGIRSQMLSLGWVPEGYGPIGVVMCAPI